MPPKRRIEKRHHRFEAHPDHVSHLMRGWSYFGVPEESLPLAWALWGAAMMAAWEGGPVPSFDEVRELDMRAEAVKWFQHVLAGEDRPLRLWGWWKFESGVPLPKHPRPVHPGITDRFKDCISIECEVRALEAMGQLTEADDDRLVEWKSFDEWFEQARSVAVTIGVEATHTPASATVRKQRTRVVKKLVASTQGHGTLSSGSSSPVPAESLVAVA